ncbi:MAG: hypothetical protein ABIT71_17685 [Vicinamibacteraceae bacterium]
MDASRLNIAARAVVTMAALVVGGDDGLSRRRPGKVRRSNAPAASPLRAIRLAPGAAA